MIFTEQTVAAVKPRPARFEIWGDDTPGFGLRVAPSGRKSWIYLYRHDGRARRLTLGVFPALSCAEARTLFAAARDVVAAGGDPAAVSLASLSEVPKTREPAEQGRLGPTAAKRRKPVRQPEDYDDGEEDEPLYTTDDAISESIDEDGVLEFFEDDDDEDDDPDSISRALYEKRLRAIQEEWAAARRDMRLIDHLMPPMPPPEAPDIPLSAMKAQHDKVSNTISKTFNILGLASLFFVITLAAPDVSFMAADARVQMPVMNFAISFDAFLLIGPVLLVALTIYLHIFIRHQRRFSAIPQEQQLPTIFNISDGAPSLITWVLFYWMPPAILAVFAYRAMPRPLMGPVMLELTIIMAAGLLFLQGRRCHPSRRRWAVPVLSASMTGLILFGLYSSLIEIPFHRDLYLFRGDLTEKDLRGFDLKNAYLKEAKLDRANLQGARMDDANMSQTSFTGADLRDTNLRQADIRSAVLENANISNADLSRADLRNAVLTDANFALANLFETRLEGAIFYPDGLKQACNWALADYGDAPPGYLGLPANIRNRISQLDFSEVVFDDIRFCRANLRGASLDKSSFHRGLADHANMRDLSANGLLATGASFIGSDLRNSSFVDARLSETDFSDANLTEATFRRADLRSTQFRLARIRNGRFVGADLTRADFIDADLSEVSFRGANLDQVDFTDAVMIEADLRGSRGLTCNQLVLARDWELTLRDQTLACGAQIPSGKK
ncbi:MAG: pentapeptide repeat-containing protein [Rhodospirillales bacterium]